ncbi:hypothetical protein [Ancylomarina sp. 16SWW S1-10-2]|uniref:hypothetical protein n=1 Tax=Ancylomarina sp. 16SWW S1-10-2 TaxID=2499681 RepID=UPI0012ADA482|nr:hypothetical protein [Ancylomarina sp. 16SWW S1-10-2]MRT94446.1 hypothetical protein [Ancylomarina sp. 16SWW S1-10-2]
MMNKRTILSAIFILSVLVALFSLINGLKLIYEFKSNIVELTIPSELEVEPENGIYDLFVVYTKSDKKEVVARLASKDVLSQIIISTKDDLNIPISKKESNVTYTILNNSYKNIGYFEIDRKQTIKIESNAKNIQSEKLAYAKEGSFVYFFDIMKYGLLFVLSVGASLIIGISLIIMKRNKNKITVG